MAKERDVRRDTTRHHTDHSRDGVLCHTTSAANKRCACPARSAVYRRDAATTRSHTTGMQRGRSPGRARHAAMRLSPHPASAHTPSAPRSSRWPLRSRPSITRPPHLPWRAWRGRMPHAPPHAPHPSRLAPHASPLTPRASRLAPHAARLTPRRAPPRARVARRWLRRARPAAGRGAAARGLASSPAAR